MLLAPNGSANMTQTQKAEAETTVLLFARLLARAYAFNSVKGFLSDFKAAQLRWSAYAERPFFEHLFYRTGMLLKVLKKEKPTDNEKKRAWNPDYFQHIFSGMEWSRVPLYHSKEWAPFEVRIVWTVMITMHEHLLRVGEVVEQRVDTQTCRRRWTRSSVTFWAGNEQVPLLDSGAPDPAWRPLITHAEIEAFPDKTDAVGRRDPFIAPIPSIEEMAASKNPLVAHAWMFCTGGLLWDLYTLNPVRQIMQPFIPLFSCEFVLPPGRLKFLHYNAFFRQFRTFGRRANPPIPLRIRNKTLGGHCFRVSGVNAAANTGANLHEVTDKGRWSFTAFVAAGGYDYMRTNFKHVAQLTMAMIKQLLIPVAK